ncbi:AzlC family ABC transporter permease [Thauera sp.]|jgi:predicted branched-subunit amino acid permease|uniref:AzlC family ABC transporter permease n=1 Tax=Thauera sp. TaxID=1905334 RepID=UPI001A576D65|nr:AzlC family ABC transporter permease [Thauera sp.]MBL8464404.1 AzlC family ABC transporter permease [Thauera sp.]HRO35191.1 AzlC family ABC transporter permease [Thauera sp.]
MVQIPTSAGGEFLAGCRDEAPLLLGVAPFGMIYGIAALAAGVPAWVAQLASAIVFAGAAQLVIVQMLAAGAGFIPIALTSGLLNLRHVLYSASMAEYVRHLPRRWRLLLAYVLTDEAYAVAVLRYQQRHAAAADHAEHTDSGTPAADATADLRHWYFLGAGFTLWAGWQLSTAAGLLFGATIPPEWELDFAVPLTFIALLTLLLRERAGQAAALVAGLGALAFAALPYKLGLVAAIVLGLAAGAWAVRRLGPVR